MSVGGIERPSYPQGSIGSLAGHVAAPYGVPLVYLAGPYAAPTEEGVLDNIHRIRALAQLAVTLGMSPVAQHFTGGIGVFGSSIDDGSPSVSRHNALLAGQAVAHAIGRTGGLLWVVTRDDGTLTEGTALEVAAWQTGALGVRVQHNLGVQPAHAADTWEGWLSFIGAWVAYNEAREEGREPDTTHPGMLRGVYCAARRGGPPPLGGLVGVDPPTPPRGR